MNSFSRLIKPNRLAVFFFVLILIIGSCKDRTIDSEDSITSTKDLINEIYTRYHNTWYPSVTFEQVSTLYKQDTIRKQNIWYEAYLFPKKLIIKYDSMTSGNGVLFRNDSMYVFRHSSLVSSERLSPDLITLSLDIYLMNPDSSLKTIEESGYDITKFSEGEFNGKEVYIIGAHKGDTISNQFWVEKERLLFVRMLKKTEHSFQDARFSKYKEVKGGWIEQEVDFVIDHKLLLNEKYRNIKIQDVSKEVFNPNRFQQSSW